MPRTDSSIYLRRERDFGIFLLPNAVAFRNAIAFGIRNSWRGRRCLTPNSLFTRRRCTLRWFSALESPLHLLRCRRDAFGWLCA